MPQTATKRKVESESTTSKSYAQETSSPLFVPEGAPRHVKKQKVAPRKQSLEYASDEGILETERFLDLVKQKSKEKKEQSKGSKAYIDAYKKAIGGEEAITKKIIEESGKVCEKQDRAFIYDFTEAYSFSRPTASSSTDKLQSFAALYKQSKTFLIEADQLLATFEELEGLSRDVDTKKVLKNTWDEEVDVCQSVIEAGKVAGEGKYVALLEGHRLRSAGEGDIGEMMFLNENGEEADMSGSVGWGKVAKKLEKGYKKFNKALVFEA